MNHNVIFGGGVFNLCMEPHIVTENEGIITVRRAVEFSEWLRDLRNSGDFFDFRAEEIDVIADLILAATNEVSKR